jgi:hypothetical protein
MSRNRNAEAPTISLFPFLAVLLCTMGALLVLLVLFSRSASMGQQNAATAAVVEELELAKENVSWRLNQLAGVRDRTAEDLAKARMQLAGVEENSRELTDELERILRTAKELEGDAGSRQATEAELAALEERLKNARESLDKARADQAQKPAAYAVVPYVGVNGTHRRPLYIECCIDGVFLQPEGIRLNPSDFEGPPGPGNPLACALRAAREHLARNSANSGDPAAQPYPLLLIRPSGVMAYYAARESIASWGSEFGYQLIDEDWTLAFPPGDPALKEIELRAVEESRRRLQWLAENRPAPPPKPKQQYRAATTRGGVVADGGPSVLGDQSRYNWTEQQAAAATPSGGRGAGGSIFGSGGGRGAAGGPDGSAGQVAGSSGAEGGAGSGEPTGPGRPLNSSGGGAAGDGENGSGSGDAILGRTGSSWQGGPGGPAAGSGTGGGGGGSSPAGSGQPDGQAGTGNPQGNSVEGGRPAGATSRFGQDRPAGGAGSPADSAGGAESRYGGPSKFGTDRPGEAGSPGGTSAGDTSGSTASAGGTSAAGGGGGGGAEMPGMLKAGGTAGGSSSASASSQDAAQAGAMAKTRGKNWASLATQDRPIPLTRPIRVECSLHEIRITDDLGRRIETRIPVAGDTVSAIDPFVRAIHTKVEGWGIAGDRMYWKPELVLTASADGQSRMDDLERLLADSGLDTRAMGRDNKIHPLPPVQRAAFFQAK